MLATAFGLLLLFLNSILSFLVPAHLIETVDGRFYLVQHHRGSYEYSESGEEAAAMGNHGPWIMTHGTQNGDHAHAKDNYVETSNSSDATK